MCSGSRGGWGGGGGAAVTAAPGGMRLWPPPRHELARSRLQQGGRKPSLSPSAQNTSLWYVWRTNTSGRRVSDWSGCCNKGMSVAHAPDRTTSLLYTTMKRLGVIQWSKRVFYTYCSFRAVRPTLNARILSLQRRLSVQSNGMRTFSKSILCVFPRCLNLHMYCYNDKYHTDRTKHGQGNRYLLQRRYTCLQ
jgi:hypothetical protein